MLNAMGQQRAKRRGHNVLGYTAKKGAHNWRSSGLPPAEKGVCCLGGKASRLHTSARKKEVSHQHRENVSSSFRPYQTLPLTLSLVFPAVNTFNSIHTSAVASSVALLRSNMAAPIPSFYRVFFAWVDPIMASPGAAMNFVAPHMFLESLASPAVRYDPHTVALFHHLGGLYFMVAFLSAVLPRMSADVKVWKALQ